MLRSRVARGREENLREAEREDARGGSLPGQAEERAARRAEFAEKKVKRETRRKDGAIFGEHDDWMDRSAVEMDEKAERVRRKTVKNVTGMDVFSQEAVRRAHERRLRVLPNRSSEALVDKEGDSEEAVTRMVQELRATERRRERFKRRRPFDEEAEDITFINERNRKFNEKIGRTFDKYTEEIRENLERGTALP